MCMIAPTPRNSKHFPISASRTRPTRKSIRIVKLRLRPGKSGSSRRAMDLLKAIITVSEKAANIARLCRQNEHLFQLLIQKKTGDANPRFVDDFKTLADVLIQQLVKHDLGHQFPELRDYIFGEESNVFSNKLGDTIAVEIKPNEAETASLLRSVLNGDDEAARLLAAEVHKDVLSTLTPPPSADFPLDLQHVGVWIDPIDSTAEYISGIEEVDACGICVSGLKCVTVLIGAYDRRTGCPKIGVVNQPFVEFTGNRWQGMCFWGTTTASSLPPRVTPTNTICVSSSEDPRIKAKLADAGYNVVEASGAGYKILTVITGLADAYVLSKDSTFKWDTCGPHAVLKSLGGDVVSFLEQKSATYNDPTKCNVGGIIAYYNPNDFDKIKDCLF